MPPQTPAPVPEPSQAPTPVPQVPAAPKSRFWLKTAAVVFVVVFGASGIAYAYMRGYVSQLIDSVAFTSTTTPPATDTGTLSVADYTRRTQTGEDRLENTVRLQIYGPAKLSGYGPDNQLISVDAALSCKMNCTGTEELRLDFIRQGMSDTDKPLVSRGLSEVQAAYDAWVTAGKPGIFYSPIVTVALPTPPPKGNVAQLSGQDAWVPVLYYDKDGDGKYSPLKDTELLYGDEFTYVWTNTSYKGVPLYEAGWNFESIQSVNESNALAQIGTDSVALEQYRKSFETSVYQLPAFHEPAGTFILPVKIPEEEFQAAKQYEQEQSKPSVIADNRLHGFMSQIQSGLAMYNAEHDSYPPTLAALSPAYLPADLFAVMPVAQFKYAALKSDCSGYHLGILLQSADSKAAHAAAESTVCPGSARDFSATDPLLFDVKK